MEVHPTFKCDGNLGERGDVLVRVEGVEFWVHKDVLMFSSPFFKSLLRGEWKESRLREVRTEEEHGDEVSAERLVEQAARAKLSESAQADDEERSESQPIDGNDDKARVPTIAQPRLACEQEHEDAESGADEVDDSRCSDHLRVGSQRRSLLRASYHTALWSQDDEARSPALSQCGDEGALSAGTDDNDSVDAEDYISDDQLHDKNGLEPVTNRESVIAASVDRRSSADQDAMGLEWRQEAARLTLQKLESDPQSQSESQAVPSRNTFKYADHLVSSATEGSEKVVATSGSATSPLERLESLVTPPISRRPSQECPRLELVARKDDPQDSSECSLQPAAAGQSRPSSRYKSIIAVVDLEEESASTFHDFLFHIYPHLDLSVTWFNCGPLLRFSDKFQVPFLRRSCINFLRAALAGRPIEAMRLAELHTLDDLYKEASRHVLDNFAAWEADELEVLSKETLLKLERKRTWFLERLLKLGLANPGRDYECQPNCPDPQNCAKMLHEKWSAAYANAFRFSPPQPSVIFRCLREFDGAAGLQLSACQGAARVWVQGLFDRMFGLGTLHTPRQFLAIKLVDVPKAGR